MTDFLRRLAPPRATDATRAVVALPSRFALGNPLTTVIENHTRAVGLEDGNDRESPAQPTRGASLQIGNASARPAYRPTSASPAGSERFDIAVIDSGGAQEPREIPSPGVERRGAEPRRAPAPPAVHAVASVGRPVLPLSHNTLAQRGLGSKDDNGVVQVTIGRIDVIASPGAAASPRRAHTPRQPTVTLAEYLRGHGRRR
jgi:hypothetical protein